MIFPFLLALAALFFFPTLSVFTPFFAIVFQKKTFLQSLWIAALCGLLIDLLSSHARFGLFSLSHLLAAATTYRFRRHFFEEKFFSIPLYTGLIALSLSVFQSLFICPLGFLTASFLMPLADMVYAFFWFTCPLMIYPLCRKT